MSQRSRPAGRDGRSAPATPVAAPVGAPAGSSRLPGSALWGRGFRPFFLLAALQGAAAVAVWAAASAGLGAVPAWLPGPWWHAHEMLFGFVAAAVAGFLLTAVPVWTATPPVAGAPLAGLVALWLAGRLAMAGAGALPAGLVAVVDLAFLPALAIALAPALARPGQARNRGFLAVLTGLTAANAVMHAQAAGLLAAGARPALYATVDGIALLIVVIGGRIAPAFTRNALQRAGVTAPVRSPAWLGAAAIAALLALTAADALQVPPTTTGALAGVAALAVAARMAGWQSARTLRDPLLWSLHLGVAWVAVGLAARAAAELLGALPPTAALHALTAGAMGGTILAVMSRVGLGHTGRPLVPPRGTVLAYGGVHGAALLRVLGPTLLPEWTVVLVLASGLLWAAAFVLFAVLYAPILLRPRIDGLPG